MRVLYVCLHNAGRSQMSEALFSRTSEWLSPPRLMELAAEAVDLYVWDRAGSDN